MGIHNDLPWPVLLNNSEYVHYGFGTFRENMDIMASETLQKIAIAEILHS